MTVYGDPASGAGYAPPLRPSSRVGNGVDDLEEGEPVEVRISRVDRLDPVLAHENRGAGIEEDVSSQIWEFIGGPLPLPLDDDLFL